MALGQPIPSINYPEGSGGSPEDNPRPEPQVSPCAVPNHVQTLDHYLFDCAPYAIRKAKIGFIPPCVLRKLLTPERVEQLLSEIPRENRRGRDLRAYARRICGDQGSGKIWLKVFAILCLIGPSHLPFIFQWVDAGHSDECLPLIQRRPSPNSRSGTSQFYTNKSPGSPLDLLNSWAYRERNIFSTYQWQVNIHVFTRRANDPVPHYRFDDCEILPFVDLGQEKKGQHPEMLGGYGKVICVRMPTCCYDFRSLFEAQKIPDTNGLFALKIMENGATTASIDYLYDREKNMLALFGGRHDHIVTLLSTFTHNDDRCLLFPWAECDLLTFWETKVAPRNHATVLWVAEQCLKLVEALHEIHYLRSDALTAQTGQKFGRHGDIKSENVLVFAPQDGSPGLGKLVLSDLGFGSVHRDVSKSNVPNESFPATLQYRPPECDIKGAKIARSFDIWTLGCLFLDMCIWWLRGYEDIRNFKHERFEMDIVGDYITGKKSDAYFEVRKQEHSDEHVFLVKESVSRCFASLKEDSTCTAYMADFLHLIETEMIIVEAENRRRRIRTRELKKKLKQFYMSCQSPAYALEPSPVPTVLRKHTGITAELNETAKNVIRDKRPTLRTYTGRTRTFYQHTEEDETEIGMDMN